MPHQRILELSGRVFDYLVDEDGDRVSGAFVSHLVMVLGLPVWKWQVVQVVRGRVEFRYLTEDDRPLEHHLEEQLRMSLRKHLGAGLDVRFVRGNFETGASGKHRPVMRAKGVG